MYEIGLIAVNIIGITALAAMMRVDNRKKAEQETEHQKKDIQNL